jgi:ABC-type nitrate/sulfonate/bicarbonate transport system ATPase subunit
MDEPLAALDAQTRLVMQSELLQIWERSRSTVVYVTHDIEEAVTLANRVILMTSRPGRIKSQHRVRSMQAPDEHSTDPLVRRTTSEFRELVVKLWSELAEEVGSALSAPRSQGEQ